MSWGQTNTSGATIQSMTGQGTPRLVYGRPYTPVSAENITTIQCYARNNTLSTKNLLVAIYDITSGRVGAVPVHTVSIPIPVDSNPAWRTVSTSFALVNTKIYAYAFVNSANDGWDLYRQTTSSIIESHATVSNYTIPPTWASGSPSTLDALIEVVTVATGATVTSINSGTPITAGKTTIPSTSTGFTGLPISITTNASGVTCSNIGGSVNAATFDISDRVDGGLYPKSGTSVTFTFTNGSESGALAQSVVKKANETTVAISSPLFIANTIPQAILSQTGRTVATGDDFYHTTYDDLVITASGDYTVSSAGTFDLWLWVSSGADAGKMFFYSVTVTESGLVVATTGRNHYIGLGVGIGF